VSNKSTRVRILFVVFVVYLVIGGGYALYSAITETGLFGLLVDVQFRLFQKAEMELTFALTVLIALTPAIPLGTYLRKKGYRLGAKTVRVVSPDGRSALVYTPVDERPPKLMWLLLIGIAPFLISVVIYGYVTVVDANNTKRPIYQMDLNRSAELPASNAKFVELSGMCQQDLKYVVEDQSGLTRRYAYTPLTPSGWTPNTPVKYFLYFETDGDTETIPGSFNPDTGRYDVPPSKGAYRTTFDGQLTPNALPTYVKNAYERKGITVADTSYTLTLMGRFDNNRVASEYSSQMYYLIPVFGGVVSAIVLFTMVLLYINRRKRWMQLMNRKS